MYPGHGFSTWWDTMALWRRIPGHLHAGEPNDRTDGEAEPPEQSRSAPMFVVSHGAQRRSRRGSATVSEPNPPGHTFIQRTPGECPHASLHGAGCAAGATGGDRPSDGHRPEEGLDPGGSREREVGRFPGSDASLNRSDRAEEYSNTWEAPVRVTTLRFDRESGWSGPLPTSSRTVPDAVFGGPGYLNDTDPLRDLALWYRREPPRMLDVRRDSP